MTFMNATALLAHPLAPVELASCEIELLEWFERLVLEPLQTSHDDRVGWLTYHLASNIGYSTRAALRLGTVATLHDIGKFHLPRTLLQKKGVFTPDERRLMQLHTTAGGRMLERHGTPLMNEAAVVALTHHERWDGTGYPHGLTGVEIPLSGRIVAITDAYDAMTEHRPYQVTRSHDEALHELRAGSGTQFDPSLLAVFLELMYSTPEHGLAITH
jgi:putative two-component system response regulator